MFALGIQIAAASLGLGAMVAVVVNGLIKSAFSLFNCTLALRPVVCVEDWRGHEEQKRDHDDSSYCPFAKS